MPNRVADKRHRKIGESGTNYKECPYKVVVAKEPFEKCLKNLSITKNKPPLPLNMQSKDFPRDFK